MRLSIRCLLVLILALVPASWLFALDKTAVSLDGNLAQFTDGRTGAFLGTVDGGVILVGGVQDGVPQRTACTGGAERNGGEKDKNLIANFEIDEQFLPVGLAYGASVSAEHALYLIGGVTGDVPVPTDLCYKITFRKEKENAFLIEEAPRLPIPMVASTAGYLNGILYVAGADEAGAPRFLKCDTKTATPSWEELPPYPGPGRVFAPGLIQNISTGKGFFLFGGFAASAGDLFAAPNEDESSPSVSSEPLSGALVYDFQTKEWRELENADALPWTVTGSSALASGTIHIVFPGVGGIAPPNAGVADSDEVRVYNTITNKFFSLGNMGSIPAAAGAFRGGHVLLPLKSTDSPGLYSLTLEEKTNRLSRLNQAIIAAYFLFLIAASLYFLSRMRGTDDFFRGGCRIPWWALGISIYGTITSAITYITVPAKSFMTNWCYILLAVGPFLAVPLLIWFYIPKISRFNFTSAYEYLEYRFNFFVSNTS